MQETGEIDRAGFQRRQVSLEKGEAPKTVQRDQHLEAKSRKDGKIGVWAPDLYEIQIKRAIIK